MHLTKKEAHSGRVFSFLLQNNGMKKKKKKKKKKKDQQLGDDWYTSGEPSRPTSKPSRLVDKPAPQRA
jgi:hypothetical protein